jgi:hypothetical protein
MSTTHYWLEKVAISNGTYITYNNERKPVVIMYNVYKNYDCKQLGVFVGADLLWSKDSVLYLKPENDSSNSSPISIKVSDLFFAPKASFFPVTNMTKANWAKKTKDGLIPFPSKESSYCRGSNPIGLELIRNNNLVAQAPPANPITNLIDDSTQVKQVIDYVFSKPPLLFSVAAILRNEDGDQHLFADAGNAPHPNQLIINQNIQDYKDKLHSGTRFGIASYYLYAKRIYKSVFKLDIGDYIVISIAYYPVVKPPETSNLTLNDIMRYYDGRIGDYRYSIYSFHLWRHALYGGFVGVAGGDYYNSGYTLKPECACKAFKLLLDAQTQPEYKRAWYHVLFYPTALYLLLLYLATTKSDKTHNKKETNDAINDLISIFKNNSDIEKQIQNDTYKKIIRRFINEIGEGHLKIIMQEGLGYVRVNSNAVEKYDNPIQMLWTYCMEKVVKRVETRNNEIEEYLNNKIKDTDRIYKEILQREVQFFNS